MEPVRFYRAAPGDLSPVRPKMNDLMLSVWKAKADGPPGGLFADPVNYAWFAMDRLGLFARDGLSVYVIHQGSRVLHRLLVTRRWYRFPFMDAQDLQIGMLWTDPSMRGRGLAKIAIAAVHDDFRDRFHAMWYLVDAANIPSIRLIERIGYPLYAYGRRTRPMGIGLMGRFEITRLASEKLDE